LVVTAGAAVLGIGLLRSEPVTLLFGGALLALGVYVAVAALVGVAVLRGRLRRSHGSVQLTTEPSEVSAGSEASGSEASAAGEFYLRGNIALRVPRLPGFVRSVRTQLRGPGSRSMEVEVPLRGRRDNAVDRRVSSQLRGLYRSAGVDFRLRDLLGFSTGQVTLALDLQVRVLPTVEEPDVIPRHGRSMGGERARSTMRQRSDELLETRRYVPGDDTRRINWNIYARWGELLVRIGEELPPPRARHYCVLYLAAPECLDGEKPGMAEARGLLCDRLVSLFAGYCHAVTRKGMGLIVTLRDAAPSSLQVGTGEEQLLLRRLAGAWWVSGEAALATASRDVGMLERGDVAGPLHGISVFAAPGAQGLTEYLAELDRYVNSLDIVLVDNPPLRDRHSAELPTSARDGRGLQQRGILKRLIFLDNTPSKPPISLDAEAARAELRHHVQGARRVEII